tara:strand:+ start:2950 stop:3870 length:921 start_codon:yes stop_codon:yes gene_type:complete
MLTTKKGDKHLNYRFRDSTQYWEGSDSNENFLINYKEAKANNWPKLKDYDYYIENPIEYKYNEYGFRADEFSTEHNGNIFIGCSHTFGTGHYLENTWSHILNEQIGGRFYNMAVPGTGIQTGFRMLEQYIDKVKADKCFIFYPHHDRYDFSLGEEDEKFSPLGKDQWNHWETIFPHLDYGFYDIKWDDKSGKALRRLLLDQDHSYYIHRSNLLAILYLCEKNNVTPYFWQDFHFGCATPEDMAEFRKVFRVNPNSPVEEARDIHMNVGWQYRLYLEMKNVIDSGKTATLEEVEIQCEQYNKTNPWW